MARYGQFDGCTVAEIGIFNETEVPLAERVHLEMLCSEASAPKIVECFT